MKFQSLKLLGNNVGPWTVAQSNRKRSPPGMDGSVCKPRETVLLFESLFFRAVN